MSAFAGIVSGQAKVVRCRQSDGSMARRASGRQPRVAGKAGHRASEHGGKIMKYAFAVAASLAASMVAGDAQAADHQIQMLDKGEKGVMVFQPDLVRGAPGDTVTFVPTDKGHNAESIWGMIPDGQRPSKARPANKSPLCSTRKVSTASSARPIICLLYTSDAADE